MNRITLLIMVLFIVLVSSKSSAEEIFFASEQIGESTLAALPKVKGVVRRIDRNLGTVMLKHERIPNLDMGAMTMSFKFTDSEMTHGLNSGDQVLFSADMIRDELTVVWIRKVE